MPQMSKFLLGSAAVSAGTWAFLAPSTARQGATTQLRGTSSAAPTAAAGVRVAALATCAVAASARRGAKQQRKAEDDAYGASHTSFYTDAVAKDKYDTLEEAAFNCGFPLVHRFDVEVLAEKLKDAKLKGMVNELLDACVKITEAALRVNLVTVNDASNAFGDRQLTVDVIADNLLWDLAKTSKNVYEASSEEEPEIVKTNEDPQWQRSGNKWICSRDKISIKTECKIFAPANMRAAQEAGKHPNSRWKEKITAVDQRTALAIGSAQEASAMDHETTSDPAKSNSILTTVSQEKASPRAPWGSPRMNTVL
eukprot:Skav235074  [mRNA]  locus=scaffold3466:165878:170057:- [translate_table: standard]